MFRLTALRIQFFYVFPANPAEVRPAMYAAGIPFPYIPDKVQRPDSRSISPYGFCSTEPEMAIARYAHAAIPATPIVHRSCLYRHPQIYEIYGAADTGIIPERQSRNSPFADKIPRTDSRKAPCGIPDASTARLSPVLSAGAGRCFCTNRISRTFPVW